MFITKLDTTLKRKMFNCIKNILIHIIMSVHIK